MAGKYEFNFKDSAGNTYSEDQVVLSDDGGKKSFHTGNGGSVVTYNGPEDDADGIWDLIKADRDAAKETNKPATAPKL